MNREKTLETLSTHSPTVLVVGGGINGIGTYRDLVYQGVDTLLVDRADFCSGASSASSRMAHGGIRYLENGEFSLVREAVQERNRMILNAPDFVKPLPTTIPIFKTFTGLFNAPLKFLGLLEKPSERGALIIKIGLLLYDAYTGRNRIVPRHTFVNRAKALHEFPLLNPKIQYAATYYDGIILSPERMSMEILLDAERQGDHARALNYVSLDNVTGESVTLIDEIQGKKFQVTPQLIINACGPWIDRTNQHLGLKTKYIGPTKGSHLILDNPELREAIGDHEFFFENKDGRIVLIFPLFDKVMIGTSDLPIDDPDKARCSEDEIDYFFEMVKRVFPGIGMSREQIVFRFSGVRPLAFTNAKTTGQITRSHHIHEDRFGEIPVYSLVGGKWTSYRAFAEQVTDRVLVFLGKKRRMSTQSLPLGKGKKLSLKTDGTYNDSEIEEIVDWEMVVHLDDLILRRTLLAYLGQLNKPLIQLLADILGNHLGWDEDKKSIEISRTLEILSEKHAVML